MRGGEGRGGEGREGGKEREGDYDNSYFTILCLEVCVHWRNSVHQAYTYINNGPD